MPHFTSYDGTKIAYRRIGTGRPLVCLPGGPGRHPDYFGDLGGLADYRELIMPETRGTGESSTPTDPATYRRDRLAEDVEGLRVELGLERMDLLAHSAGGVVGLYYAAAYPQRIRRLVLHSPGLFPLGLTLTDAQQRAAMARRSGEPWYEDACAAIDAAGSGDTSDETRHRYLPFFYGRWDLAAQRHARLGFTERHKAVAAEFYGPGAPEPAAIKAALAAVNAPVMMYVGELEIGPTPEQAAEAVASFAGWQLTVHPQASHYPWLDDPDTYVANLRTFLD
ncbi:alpha/beta hydrolase [Kribbella sp. NPDC026611]|uniref:alpha/beta fold hydrolase n=1 Tax=Kribbella sp. NPDC026611 TaxID=3154911 RepID=UPI0033FB42F1